MKLVIENKSDRQQLLQHLLRAGADVAFMWENDVLMVNRQAQPLWRNGGPPKQPSISKGSMFNQMAGVIVKSVKNRTL